MNAGQDTSTLPFVHRTDNGINSEQWNSDLVSGVTGPFTYFLPLNPFSILLKHAVCSGKEY